MSMQLGMIGLGKMGGGMVRRLLAEGHEIVAFDLDPDLVTKAGEAGAAGSSSIDELTEKLDTPRAVWVMVPAGEPTDQTLRQLAAILAEGDIVIDGGNSRYTDTIHRHETLRKEGIELVDVGTSGGIHGEREGYCMMAGGREGAIERLRPLFESLAPAPDRGWGHVGPPGSGHFVKMVHNGIEYGLMQAWAEGFSILRQKKELAPDPAQIARIWQEGSVIRSWLLELAADLLGDDPTLEGFEPWVDDSGEGRWTVAEAIDLDVPAPVITLALIQRLRSRDEESYADRFLAGLRNRFGGHSFRKSDE